MILTHHIKSKMSQRGITKEMIALASLYGKQRRDQILLNRQRLKLLLKKIDFFRATLRSKKHNKLHTKRLNALRKVTLKLHDKGGITLVMVDGVCITSYNTDSRKYHKKGKKVRRK